MLEARGVEEVDQVLRGEIPGGPGRIRAAAGAAGRAVEAADPGIQPCLDVRERRAARVVEVVGDPIERDPGRDRRAGQGATWLGTPTRSCRRSRPRRRRGPAAAARRRPPRADRRAPVYGQPNAVETYRAATSRDRPRA